MCGINGIFSYNSAASSPDPRELLATREHMTRRGPDGHGEWWDSERRIVLGHRRLALVDLSDAGAQPMASADGRYVVTFNGEIYNHRALRSELERDGAVFRSHSDTEVLLALYARAGEGMLRFLRGMFAFAIWDNLKRELFLARDPYGIKPLYISNDGWTFRFASQVRALLAGGRVSRAPEPAGVVGFHIWGSVPEPFTLYRDIEALPAGCSLLVTSCGPRACRRFSSVADTLAMGSLKHVPEREATDLVRLSIRDSVHAHMIADVDVGVFLSAGVDSSVLLGIMAELGARPRAITLSFSEFQGTGDDESVWAKFMARIYGADHIVREVTQAEFNDDLPLMLDAMDQPTIDGVNAWFVAKATREAGLKAAISGIGGDELFAGYSSFAEIPRMTSWLRLAAGAPGLGVSVRMLARALGLRPKTPKAAAILEYGGAYGGAYLLRRGLFLPHELHQLVDEDLVIRGIERLALEQRLEEADIGPEFNPISRIAAFESTLYLRNQLLRDADWAGMAHSVEVRTPLVDYRLLETLAPLVPSFLRPEIGKRALASALLKPLPEQILLRPKSGFGVPFRRWLSGRKSGEDLSRGQASRVWSRRVFAAFAGGQRPGRAAA
ncbi:MAG: asparagine synthase (glutamine-hydrolyzing) [Beijerinckiaceae bacterium]